MSESKLYIYADLIWIGIFLEIKELVGEQKGKKKLTKVKTFPVPFPLVENQGKININTNNHSKPSEEKITTQAFKFHSQGNISEAAKLYQFFINDTK